MRYVFTLKTDGDFSFKINNKLGNYSDYFSVMFINDTKNVESLKKCVINLVDAFTFFSVDSTSTHVETIEEYRKQFIEEVEKWQPCYGEDYLTVSVSGNYGFTIQPVEYDFDRTIFV
jgi:hypothetical protein